MKKYYSLTGLAAGFLNGLFGAGGGIIVVPLLENSGIKAKNAHATSIAIIAPLSLISSFFYFNGNHLDFPSAFRYVPAGIIGVLLGTFFLKKIPAHLLKRCFGAVMIISAIRLLWK